MLTLIFQNFGQCDISSFLFFSIVVGIVCSRLEKQIVKLKVDNLLKVWTVKYTIDFLSLKEAWKFSARKKVGNKLY